MATDNQGGGALSESSAAASVGHLSGKVKKTIKNALNKMEQPNNALPPVHRATTTRNISESSDHGSGNRISRFRSSNSVSKGSVSSIELPIFSDADDDYDPSKDINSSPEQETVLPKAAESTRPHIQNVFNTTPPLPPSSSEDKP